MYIFDKQIEGAGLLVVNKIDLLPAEKLAQLKNMLKGRAFLLQNSLAEQGVSGWLDFLESGTFVLPGKSPHMDYERYGRAEAALAWLDEGVELETAPGDEKRAVETLIRGILDGIRQRDGAVAHLKFWVRSGGVERKISFPFLEEPGWEEPSPRGRHRAGCPAGQRPRGMAAGELRQVVQHALTHCGAAYHEIDVSFFSPAQPSPTHIL